MQDVAPDDAGKLLGLTNSCGTAAGLVANLLTGVFVGRPQGYAFVFGSCVALYLAAGMVWLVFAKGEELRLPSRAKF